MYTLINDSFTKQLCSISKINDDGTGISIPLNETNTDYQAYLKWVSEGGVPLPADE
jgi:hypothetical protein